MDCAKEGPVAILMEDARRAAEEQGWQVGMRGSTRVAGWEEDFCADCKGRHPRTHCSGWRARCVHRSLYTLTRPSDSEILHACGAHLTILVKEMVPGGKLEIEETPV
jgi:hypothetical protein